jgi:hypothetical protein
MVGHREMIRIRHIDPQQLFVWMEEHGILSESQPRWMPYWNSRANAFALAPSHRIKYLYRGQTARYSPCLPAASRGVSTERGQLECLLNFVRMHWFCDILSQHPMVSYLAGRNLLIDRLALAQHYGIPTVLVDMTESIEVAAFFATCEYAGNAWRPCTSGTGYMYRLDWEAADGPVRSRFRPIGLQPFPRPHAQKAWTFCMRPDEDFEEVHGIEVVAFEHAQRVGEELLSLFDGGKKLFPVDILSTWAKRITGTQEFPLDFSRWVLQKGAENQAGIDERFYIKCRLNDMQRLLGVSFSSLPLTGIVQDTEIAHLNRSFHVVRDEFMAKVNGTTDIVLTR